MDDFIACWRCYQPQLICRVADSSVPEETKCRFPDIVILLCYGIFYRAGRTQWFQKYFQRRFDTELEYILWLGETASLGGNKCIQANCVAAFVLAELLD